MNKHLPLLSKLCVMCLLLTFLYSKADIDALTAALTGFRWRWLPLIYAMCLCNSLLSSWKWHLLLKADGVHVPLKRLLGSYLVGSFFNLFLPSSIGGDAYRIMDARAHGGGAKGFASVFVDRMTGFLALTIWGVVFSVPGADRLPDKRILALPVLVFAAMASSLWLVLHRSWVERLLRLMHLHRIERIDSFARRVLDSVAVYRSNQPLVARVAALSMLFQLVAIGILFSISRAMAWQVPFLSFAVFVPLITLGEALPISVFGIGVREGLYVLFFSQVGATREQALAMALVYVLVTLVYSLSGGIVFVLRKGGTGQSVRR